MKLTLASNCPAIGNYCYEAAPEIRSVWFCCAYEKKENGKIVFWVFS